MENSPENTLNSQKDAENVPREHNHSFIIHGRTHQTDIYPDGCLVHPEWQLPTKKNG